LHVLCRNVGFNGALVLLHGYKEDVLENRGEIVPVDVTAWVGEVVRFAQHEDEVVQQVFIVYVLFVLIVRARLILI